MQHMRIGAANLHPRHRAVSKKDYSIMEHSVDWIGPHASFLRTKPLHNAKQLALIELNRLRLRLSRPLIAVYSQRLGTQLSAERNLQNQRTQSGNILNPGSQAVHAMCSSGLSRSADMLKLRVSPQLSVENNQILCLQRSAKGNHHN